MSISKPRPGFVTIPTPSPPSISIWLIESVNDKFTIISAPWVTSGSSPPSLITEHFALVVSNSHVSSLILSEFPLGRTTGTLSILH